MLRGNHECKAIAMIYGLATQCKERLGDDIEKSDSIFEAFMEMFSYMPMGAVYTTPKEKILCIHGCID